MSVLLTYKNMFFLDFLEFWQAHSDPPIRLAGTNSDCGSLPINTKMFAKSRAQKIENG